MVALLHSLPMAAPPPAAATTPGELPTKLNDKVEKLIDELVHNLRRRYTHRQSKAAP